MARATILLVLVTDDGYWIAADGVRSMKDKISSRVCKIHETNFGLIMKGGDSEGYSSSGAHYSTDKELRELLNSKSAENTSSFREAIAAKDVYDIRSELVLLVNDPLVTKANITSNPMSTPVPENVTNSMARVLIAFEKKDPHTALRIMQVAPFSKRSTAFSIRPLFTYDADVLPKWEDVRNIYVTSGLKIPRSLHMFLNAVPYEKSDQWVQEHPEQAIREVLDAASTAHPNEIGAPYSIVHLIREKVGTSQSKAASPGEEQKLEIRWIEKGMCPAWDESISSRDWRQYVSDVLGK